MYKKIQNKALFLTLVKTFILYIILIIALMFITNIFSINTYILGIVITIIFVITFIMSILRFNIYGYYINDEEVSLRSGFFTTQKSYIPFSRIQQIEISAGPIQKNLKLANVTFTTAGSTLVLNNLDLQNAEEIKEKAVLIVKEYDEQEV